MLTDEDRMTARHVIDGHDVIEYSVSYDALIGGRWRKVARYDNSHGYPHKHVYNPDLNNEYKQNIDGQNNNQALTQAIQSIKNNFMTMRQNYIIALERHGGQS